MFLKFSHHYRAQSLTQHSRLRSSRAQQCPLKCPRRKAGLGLFSIPWVQISRVGSLVHISSQLVRTSAGTGFNSLGVQCRPSVCLARFAFHAFAYARVSRFLFLPRGATVLQPSEVVTSELYHTPVAEPAKLGRRKIKHHNHLGIFTIQKLCKYFCQKGNIQ